MMISILFSLIMWQLWINFFPKKTFVSITLAFLLTHFYFIKSPRCKNRNNIWYKIWRKTIILLTNLGSMLLLTTSHNQLMRKMNWFQLLFQFEWKYWMTLHANWNELEFNYIQIELNWIEFFKLNFNSTIFKLNWIELNFLNWISIQLNSIQ